MDNVNNSGSINFPPQEVAWEEFVEVTGVRPEHLQELLELGWIAKKAANSSAVFHDADIYRVRKLERICGAFELPVIGGTIIVDLLDRIDRLEQMIRNLNALEE